MIQFFIGTKAQFIKMAPVMLEFQRRGVPFRYIDSGQHASFTKSLRQVFGLHEPDINLHRDKDITSITAAVAWTFKLLFSTVFRRRWLRDEVFAGGGICLIHGDTLSTYFGLKMAQAAGLKVAHVEAGLRSFCIWHPFPEELIRIYCMKHCDLLFAPSQQAYDNLATMKVPGRVVKVSGNTVADSLRFIADKPLNIKIPAGDFALAACHRLETITSRKRLAQVVSLLNDFSHRLKVLFVTHKPTRRYLRKFGLESVLSSEIVLLDMLDYTDFAALMRSAKMVLADGGSIQEECAYLNKPCLILRMRTERPDGLGKNALVWQFDNSVVDIFLGLANAPKPPESASLQNPSKEIVDALLLI